MAQTKLELFAERRWFFWPAMLTVVLLGKTGILRDQHKAAKWLVDHAMRVGVR